MLELNLLKNYRENVASLAVSIGVGTILIGGGISFFFGREGFLSLNQGKQKSGFSERSGREIALGFSISLRELEIKRETEGKGWLMVFLEDQKKAIKLPAEEGAYGHVDVGQSTGTGTDFKIVKKIENGKLPSLLVEVKDLNGDKSEVWVSQGEEQTDRNRFKNVTLLYVLSDSPIQSLKSVLEIQEKEGNISTHTVEVNKPLRYKGYTFYQMDPPRFDFEEIKQTQLLVMKDPGRWVVYGGLMFFYTGLLGLFYLNPYFMPSIKKQSERNNQNVD